MGHYRSEMENTEKEEKEYLDHLLKTRKYLHNTIDSWVNDLTQRKERGGFLRFEARQEGSQLVVTAVEERRVSENRFLMEPL